MEYVYVDESSRILCNNNGLIYVKPLVITTTTTTTEFVVDIYYGVSSYSRVTENTILSTFLLDTGNVGSINGRLYNFPSEYSYKYWCIPDLYNDEDKVIKEVSNTYGLNILAYDSYYNNYQVDPTPAQSITYGKIIINGIIYRIYRTILKSSYPEYYVYSF